MKKSILTIDFDLNYALFYPDSIITQINSISATIHQRTLKGGANLVEFNSKLLPTIQKMEYYKESSNDISGKYNIKVNDKIKDDVIIVSDKKTKMFGIINIINKTVKI